jgi:hypothetical protein
VVSRAGILIVVLAACDAAPSAPAAPPGVIFTYPVNGQLDVPLGSRIVVTFTDPVSPDGLVPCNGGPGPSVTGAFCLVGPAGAVAAMPVVSGDNKSVAFEAPPLDPGATYSLFVRQEVAPNATNLPATDTPLVTFTTRSDRPRAAPPALVAVNGSDPTKIGTFRPIFETTTIELLFSEPLDPRSVALAPGAIQLVDASGAAVAATIVTDGIHVAIDPVDDLVAGAAYSVKLGAKLVDLGGQPIAPLTVAITPTKSLGSSPAVKEPLRMRQSGDPGPSSSRSGTTPNAISISKPIIGAQTSQLGAATLIGEMGDPTALSDKSIAFTLRRGQRLSASGLAVALDGVIPSGLQTGNIQIELLTDAGGRLYRNPFRSADQLPDNDLSPIYVDLSLDIAIFATDPTGNAVMAQTVLGIQASGTVNATDGVLDIETVASMEMGLLGVTKAPTNFVMELISDPNAAAPTDTTPPALVATHPSTGVAELPVDEGVELIFSEPIDLGVARAGAIKLIDPNGATVPSVIESHGAAIVVRPIQPLAYSTSYRVVFANVTDVAGNTIAATPPLDFTTPRYVATNAPLTASAIHPGAPCALAGGTSASPGSCVGGLSDDDLYQPFQLAANEPIVAVMTQPIAPGSVRVVGTCGIGSVRVEAVDGNDNCTAAVPGTLDFHDRTIVFVPDAPWTAGNRYRLTLSSDNGGSNCNSGDLCGPADSSSFDPLNGTQGTNAAGGPDLVAPFVGAAPSDATFMISTAGPYTDINGSGVVETGEVPRDANRSALHILGTSGAVTSATFTSADCSGTVSGTDSCTFLSGAMPVQMQTAATNCALPDGTTAATCVPVTLSPQAMYGTSVAMTSKLVGLLPINSNTGTTVLRVREPSGGPVTGYIVDGGGMPIFVVALHLYMDAPDLSLPLSSHDLHSKPLQVLLKGPLQFLPDGRLAIAVTNQEDVPVTINISAPAGITGAVMLSIPKNQMKLQLVSPTLRGAAP